MQWPGQKRRGAGTLSQACLAVLAPTLEGWKGVQFSHHPRTHPPHSSTVDLNRISLDSSDSLPLINYFCITCFVKGRSSLFGFRWDAVTLGASDLPSPLCEQATQFYFSASTHRLHPMESCQGESNLSKQDIASDKILPTPCTSERPSEAIDFTCK